MNQVNCLVVVSIINEEFYFVECWDGVSFGKHSIDFVLHDSNWFFDEFTYVKSAILVTETVYDTDTKKNIQHMFRLTRKPPIHFMTFKPLAFNHIFELVKAVNACIPDGICIKIKCNANWLSKSLDHFSISLVRPVLLSPLFVSCSDRGTAIMFKVAIAAVFKVHYWDIKVSA